MQINHLWDKLSQPSDVLESFKKDVAEGKVPELPYYIVAQNDLKAKIQAKIQTIDSDRMTTNLIVASYGNGKTNLIKYLQLFFNKAYKQYGITVNYSRADAERTDIILFMLKIIQDNYLDSLIDIIKNVKSDEPTILGLVNNFNNNFAEIKQYTEALFDVQNDPEKITEIIYLGTGRLYNKRYFDKYQLEQLKDFNRREILVLFLNILSLRNEYVIFAIDEVEKIREKSKIRFSHFLTSYRELVDLFNQIKGHYLLVAMTDSVDSTLISESNPALYTRIKDDIIPVQALTNKQDKIELIQYLDELFGKNEDVASLYSQLRKSDTSNNRLIIQEISKLLHKESVVKPLSELLTDNSLSQIYADTKEKLTKDDAFKNLHRKFFDPLEYYIESIGIDSSGLNKQERVLIDESVEKVHYFIFNSYIEDYENEKNKISKLLNDNPEKQIVVYSPETLEMTNSMIGIDDKVKIVDYVPEELFIILEIYRENYDFQAILNDVISIYTKQNL
jgi:hypothetical protein